MNFTAIPHHAIVFVDANTFVYHFSQHPILAKLGTALLKRMALGDVQGQTSAAVLSDVAHRLMVMEASIVLGWTSSGVSKRLRQRPGEIQKLSSFRQSVIDVLSFGVQVLPVTYALAAQATTISRNIGLLSGDALIVAMMNAQGITHLASHDSDFDRVPGITRFAPV